MTTATACTPPPHSPPSFSAYASTASRHLHSFPTRRSSDLGGDADQHRLFWRILLAPSPHYGRLNGRGPDLAPEDRKSTRLNSSHTVISYAVFCLKKKITKTPDATATRAAPAPSSTPPTKSS